MDKLANVFSVLTLDAEDDTDQITTLVAAKDESKSPKSGQFSKNTVTTRSRSHRLVSFLNS